MQATLTAFPIGGDWCDAHPEAAKFARHVAWQHNALGKPCSFRIKVVPGLLYRAEEFGLLRNGEPYAVDHNDIPWIEAYLHEQYGCIFTRRRATCDAGQYTHATPVGGEAA